MKQARFSVIPVDGAFDIYFTINEKPMAGHEGVLESELDVSVARFKDFHNCTDMIQILPSGEERLIP